MRGPAEIQSPPVPVHNDTPVHNAAVDPVGSNATRPSRSGNISGGSASDYRGQLAFVAADDRRANVRSAAGGTPANADAPIISVQQLVQNRAGNVETAEPPIANTSVGEAQAPGDTENLAAIALELERVINDPAISDLDKFEPAGEALRVLNECSSQNPGILNQYVAQKIIDIVLEKYANEPLTRPLTPLPGEPRNMATRLLMRADKAVATLAGLTRNSSPGLTARMVNQALSRYENFYKDNCGRIKFDRPDGLLFDPPSAREWVSKILTHIAGTPEYDKVAARFISLGASYNLNACVEEAQRAEKALEEAKAGGSPDSIAQAERSFSDKMAKLRAATRCEIGYALITKRRAFPTEEELTRAKRRVLDRFDGEARGLVERAMAPPARAVADIDPVSPYINSDPVPAYAGIIDPVSPYEIAPESEIATADQNPASAAAAPVVADASGSLYNDINEALEAYLLTLGAIRALPANGEDTPRDRKELWLIADHQRQKLVDAIGAYIDHTPDDGDGAKLIAAYTGKPGENYIRIGVDLAGDRNEKIEMEGENGTDTVVAGAN
jgi:hypothetical protein